MLRLLIGSGENVNENEIDVILIINGIADGEGMLIYCCIICNDKEMNEK